MAISENRQQDAFTGTLSIFAFVIVLLSCCGMCPPEGCYLLAGLHTVGVMLHVSDGTSPVFDSCSVAVWLCVGRYKDRRRARERREKATAEEMYADPSGETKTPMMFEMTAINKNEEGQCVTENDV